MRRKPLAWPENVRRTLFSRRHFFSVVFYFTGNLVFHDTRFCQIILTNLYTVKSEKNSTKNCAQWGLNPGPLDHHSNALLTVLAWYVLVKRFLK